MSSHDPQDDQDQALRADCYLFLAGLLSQAPAAEQLRALATVADGVDPDAGDAGALAAAWRDLYDRAGRADAAAVEQEFFNLFVGLGRGELVPFGSWYLTGFLQEQPLVDLRDSLADLGLQRVESSANTEDHIAQELAVMAALIASPGECALAQQRAFFEQHLAPWAGRFFGELSEAKSADFYAGVGRLGAAFCAFEQQYLAMPS